MNEFSENCFLLYRG